MTDDHTTAVVQRYLNALDGDTPAEPIIRALLDHDGKTLLESLQRGIESEEHQKFVTHLQSSTA